MPDSFTALWDSVQATDPKYTKGFSKAGGFKGTAINATWLEKQATKSFGPKGIGWGVEIEDEKFVSGHAISERDAAIIHVLRIRLWFMYEGVRGEIVQYGQTTMVGVNKHGAFTDEEAPKKSLTDATTKALSGLGFGSDIFIGLYDDNKYVAEVTKQFAGPVYTEAQKAAFDDFHGSSSLGLYLFRKHVGDDVYMALYNSFDKNITKMKSMADDREKEGLEVFNAIVAGIEDTDGGAVMELIEDEAKSVLAMLNTQLNTPQRAMLKEMQKAAA